MAGRYIKQQWQSGVIASPFGPINGPRLNYLENAMSVIYDDHDAHVASAADVHPQYLLEPAPVVNGVLYSTGASFTLAKLTKDQIASNAGIQKTQLAALQIVDADVQGPISKGKLDLVGQIGQAELAPGIGVTLPGMIVDYGGDTAPTGWLLCDGSTYDGTNSTYLALWNIIGLKYGGTGQSAFKVPDYRGRVSVMKGTHTDVDTIGESDGTALAARRPAHGHSHTFTLPNHVHSLTGAPSITQTSGGGGGLNRYTGFPGLSGTFDGSNVTSPAYQVGIGTLAVGNPTTLPTIPGAIGPLGAQQDSSPYLVSNRIIKL